MKCIGYLNEKLERLKFGEEMPATTWMEWANNIFFCMEKLLTGSNPHMPVYDQILSPAMIIIFIEVQQNLTAKNLSQEINNHPESC
jgi:hypothetical protein